MFPTTTLGHWQPIPWLSSAIDYQLAGQKVDPATIHATSLLIHSLNAVFIYFIALRLFAAAGLGATGQPSSAGPSLSPLHLFTSSPSHLLAAALAALLWSIHPLRCES